MTGGPVPPQELARLSALFKAGRHGEVVQAARRLLEQRPDNAGLHGIAAQALTAMGRFPEAEEGFRRTLQLDPGLGIAWSSLAHLLEVQGRVPEALECLRRAVALQPSSAALWNRMGNALRAAGRMDEARAAYERAIALEPSGADSYTNLGTLLARVGASGPAEAALRRAVELAPQRAEFHSNLGNLFKDLGDFAQACASYTAAVERDPGFAMARSNYVFSLNYLPGVTAAQMKEAARGFGAWAASQAKGPAFAAGPRRAGPLRVGLVSGDLRAHPVGYFLESVLAAWPRERVELFAYPTYAVADQVTARLQKHLAHWTPIAALGDAQAAARIAADGIDLLVDLSGHSAHNRLPLFAWRPARVQATWLGYFATTGVEQIDWLIADTASVKQEDEDSFTERIWRLPRTRMCFTPPRAAPEVAALRALATGAVTFGSFQVLAKINDEVLALWSRVLRAVPRSRLRVQNAQMGDAGTREAFAARLRACGVDLGRVTLAGRQPRREYFAAHADVDVILDTFPYPGGTTTCEALWMGVPTLTLTGRTMVARQGESLLEAANLPQWVARDADDYVARAVRLTAELQALASLRAGLRQHVAASPLFDAPAFARDLAAAFEAMAAS